MQLEFKGWLGWVILGLAIYGVLNIGYNLGYYF